MNELAKVVAAFDAKPKGDGTFTGTCPLCGHHALAINAGKKAAYTVWCFRCEGAGQERLAKLAHEAAHGNGPAADLSKARTTTRKKWDEGRLRQRMENAEKALAVNKAAQEFLHGRGINMRTAQAFRLGFRTCYKAQRVVVPYFDGEFGTVYQLRYRAITPVENKDDKWKAEKRELGYRRLFNLPLLLGWDPADPQPVVITESELDAIMLAALGINAISVDSAKHRLTDTDLALLKDVRNLILAFDQDEDGKKCTVRFKEQLPKARVLGGYGCKDLGDLRAAIGPEQFERRLNNFLERVR